MAIKIDLQVPPCKPVSDVAQFVSQCEEACFDGVGILDSQMLERDVFVSMAMAAQATSRIRISSAVLNPVTRHVSVMASAMKTVSETAPGRAKTTSMATEPLRRPARVRPEKVSTGITAFLRACL